MYAVSTDCKLHSGSRYQQDNNWDTIGYLGAKLRLYDRLMKKKTKSVSSGMLMQRKTLHGMDYLLTEKALDTVKHLKGK